ncbi:YTH domain-containing protein 1-like isoform X1 [Zingiber officinale]|uniref:YTH domain-containing protein 1-like isoform X1 n=2 Tax=Zingiber officinale TaxID=94328 RepID=UPI001C4BEFF5|nr:YTH domain-containing protein 1-like isoform X1 [Zingiber officinale]
MDGEALIGEKETSSGEAPHSVTFLSSSRCFLFFSSERFLFRIAVRWVILKLETGITKPSWASVIFMMRQASIRNQRNKGMRLNSFLQICILTLVFFWLLYQLKHSFDKKKGPDEHGSRSLNNVVDSHSEFTVLGRKTLPHDQAIVSEGKVSNEDKENEEEVQKGEEDGESQHTMDDEVAKEIPEDGIDELDNEQEDEQDYEAEDGDDAGNEEEKDEQVEEAEFLDDQDPEEDSLLEAHEKGHRDRSNGTGDRNNRNVGNNSTITDLADLQNDIDYNNSLTTRGSSVEKLEQDVSAINHSKLKGNLLTAGVLDVRVNRQTNENLGKNNLLPLDNEALIQSIGNAQNTAISLQRNDKSNTTLAYTL